MRKGEQSRFGPTKIEHLLGARRRCLRDWSECSRMASTIWSPTLYTGLSEACALCGTSDSSFQTISRLELAVPCPAVHFHAPLEPVGGHAPWASTTSEALMKVVCRSWRDCAGGPACRPSTVRPSAA
ncbi:MAG: hypothetical protein R3D03_07780 [Geminicoccaceae bacterium]